MAEITVSLKDLFGDEYKDMISDLLCKIRRAKHNNYEMNKVCFLCECELSAENEQNVCEACLPKAKEIKNKLNELFS